MFSLAFLTQLGSTTGSQVSSMTELSSDISRLSIQNHGDRCKNVISLKYISDLAPSLC
jgi:hypothetical protein